MSFRTLQQDRFMSPDIVAVVRLLQEGKVATECYYEFRPTKRGDGRGRGKKGYFPRPMPLRCVWLKLYSGPNLFSKWHCTNTIFVYELCLCVNINIQVWDQVKDDLPESAKCGITVSCH